MSVALELTPVETLKGVGGQTAMRLHKLGINTVQDLLFHFPMRYEDRSRVIQIAQLKPGESALVVGKIESCELAGGYRRILVVKINDISGSLSLRFFHFSARQRESLVAGTFLACYGEPRWSTYDQGWEMIHPDVDPTEEGQVITSQGLMPVYPLTQGLYQKSLRHLMVQALDTLQAAPEDSALQEWLPEQVLLGTDFPPLKQAVQEIHSPPINLLSTDGQADTNDSVPAALAMQRIAFEELLAHHLSLGRCRQQFECKRGPQFKPRAALVADFLQQLPFSLTRAQQRVVGEIEADCTSGRPMMRLLQGDVGSGKTVVAACAALSAVSAGYQIALMAPTELLAEQHAASFKAWLKPVGVTLACLLGQHKGLQRKALLEQIENASASVVIGTHALFQEQVIFAQLGLVIIDEQHRFGVDQRMALLEKGSQNGLYPHQLIMTATPIPRTLAMLQFSDLRVSVIDELPPGRKPITTSVISSERRDEVIQRIQAWTQSGRQTYWVCTLIDESEVLQCEAAEKTAELLRQTLPEVRVALIHGRLKAEDKEQVMQAFKAHDIDLLVATTVIEVGVDVANAGLMVIENSERLGLSQLHQLRGRVGRGTEDSYCVLMYRGPLSKTAHQRLTIMRQTSDGFEIAECDLEMRGPGEFMGTRQAGEMQFRVADLGRDKGLLPKVLEAAKLIESEYPEHIEPLIMRWLGQSAQYFEV